MNPTTVKLRWIKDFFGGQMRLIPADDLSHGLIKHLLGYGQPYAISVFLQEAELPLVRALADAHGWGIEINPPTVKDSLTVDCDTNPAPKAAAVPG